jgi:hypothetical protein
MTGNETSNVKHVIPEPHEIWKKLNKFEFLLFHFCFLFIFGHENKMPEYQTCFSRAFLMEHQGYTHALLYIFCEALGKDV